PRRRTRNAVRNALRSRALLFLGLVAIAICHIGEHRLPVDKTDGDLAFARSLAGEAAFAFHAMGGYEIGRFRLPGEGMNFVHVSSSRWIVCRGSSPCVGC